ncbi:MAG: hypothetical protein KAU20_05995, partial [Nanoarchaeota archaeon]|nr:hypothetical protein [Nanoarchaeota archaeon]
LGFVPPFISNTHVETIAIADPKRNDDGNHIMMGRLTFVVRAPDEVETLEANLIDGYDTQVKIGVTDQGYIYSGDNIPVPTPTCEPGDVLDSNSLVIGEAPSGGFFVVVDSDYLIKDTYGQPLYSGSLLATTDLDQIIQDTTVKNSDDTYIQAVLAEDELILPDEDITLNGDPFLTKASVKDQDIELEDQGGNQVPVVSTYGNVATINIPEQLPSRSSKVLRTGSTTNHGIGDQPTRGRNVDFFTLDYVNEYGHSFRFVGMTGGYSDGVNFFDVNGVATTYALAFPNTIVLDFSSRNPTDILTYYLGDSITVRSYNVSLPLHVASTFGGLTAWYLWNDKEMVNIMNLDSWDINSNWIYHQPFNAISSKRYFNTATRAGTLICRSDMKGQ